MSQKKYDTIDRPFVVVAIFPDGSGLYLDESETEGDARDRLRYYARHYPGAETHVVSLPDLLAWVRANSQEVSK